MTSREKWRVARLALQFVVRSASVLMRSGSVFRYRCKKKAHTRTGQKWADEDGKKSIDADFDKVSLKLLIIRSICIFSGVSSLKNSRYGTQQYHSDNLMLWTWHWMLVHPIRENENHENALEKPFPVPNSWYYSWYSRPQYWDTNYSLPVHKLFDISYYLLQGFGTI